MKFTYNGEYPPQGFIVMYGVEFWPGKASEVTDEFAVRKLTNHHMFARDEEQAPAEPKPKRGRKPKETEETVEQ